MELPNVQVQPSDGTGFLGWPSGTPITKENADVYLKTVGNLLKYKLVKLVVVAFELVMPWVMWYLGTRGT